MTRALRYRIVDAFTDRPFAGNPAAVVLPPEGDPAEEPDDRLRQEVAAEMNLSETAFPSAPGPDGVRRLRWFTPTTEVALCGHATLATAHALLEEGADAPLRFHSLSGRLTVHREEDGRLRMDFPLDRPARGDAPAGLAEALGLTDGGDDGALPFLAGRRCAIVPLEDRGGLDALVPDPTALERVRLPEGVMGVSVTAPAREEGVDFVSRFFGPWVGVPEDPVTGMAHCVLGPWWAERLGRDELTAVQGSTRRGTLGIRIAGERVHLLGDAVTVARGELRTGPPR